MKVRISVFVEAENLGKAMNALTDAGITGFYILEHKGMSPQDWKGFFIKEDPESVIEMIEHHANDSIVIDSVVDEKMADKIVKLVQEVLKGEKYTILEVPIRRIVVGKGGVTKY